MAFVTAYNFAKHLKALRWRTPFQAVCDAWKVDPSPFKIDPRHLIPGPHNYGVLPKACRPYRAKTKGKVERPFRYMREDFFLARTFRSLDDLNAQFTQWLDQVANVRLHATTQRVVIEHFRSEEHTSELQSRQYLVCRLLLEKKTHA